MASPKLRFHRDRRGFGMVEVILATGLTGILVAAALVIPPMMARSGGDLDSKLGQVKLQKDLREILMNQSLCEQALTSRTFNTGGPTDLRINFQGSAMSSAPSESDLAAYNVRVKQFQLVSPRLVSSLGGSDAIYSARVQLATEALKGGHTAQFRSSTVGTVYFQTSGGTITQCLTRTNETDSTSVVCTNLGGTMAGGVCQVTPVAATVTCADGQYLKGFDTRGNARCEPVPQRVVHQRAPATTPTTTTLPDPTAASGVAPDPGDPTAGSTQPPPPPMVWTWAGLWYQTTCNRFGICDGVEKATCAGPACPGSWIQCYCAMPRGQPGHPVGSTQTSTPTGYNCFLH